MTNISADLLKPFYDLLIVELESEVNENEKWTKNILGDSNNGRCDIRNATYTHECKRIRAYNVQRIHSKTWRYFVPYSTRKLPRRSYRTCSMANTTR